MRTRIAVVVVLLATLALFSSAACTDTGAGTMDLAHAAVHEMDLRIAEEESDTRGTSAFAVIAWADARDDMETVPLSDSVMMNFPDGSTLTVEFYTETMRLRGWEVR